MDKTKRILIFKLFSAICCVFAVIVSAVTMEETIGTAPLIGLIAGSFGAGAMMVNILRDYSEHRRRCNDQVGSVAIVNKHCGFV